MTQVKVKPDFTDFAWDYDEDNCPLALAIESLLKEKYTVGVTLSVIRIYYKPFHLLAYGLPTTHNMSAWIIDLDNKRDPDPNAAFVIDIPQEYLND